jgi:hypothetical protein
LIQYKYNQLAFSLNSENSRVLLYCNLHESKDCQQRNILLSQLKMVEATDNSNVIQLSIPLPRSMDTQIYMHLTVRSKSIMVFLTTATLDEAAGPVALGSFVYALPDVGLPRRSLLFYGLSSMTDKFRKEIQSQSAIVDSVIHCGVFP